MEKIAFNRYSFTDYPPTEILEEEYYKKSLKNLSFQYRNREDKDLLAFVSLQKERIPLEAPELEGSNIENGCRILMARVRKIVKPDNWLITDISLLYTLLEEMELRVSMWCDTNNSNRFEFDYLWFDLRDYDENEGIELMEHLDDMKQVNSLVYKNLDRNDCS
jgi:hypothetical protein